MELCWSLLTTWKLDQRAFKGPFRLKQLYDLKAGPAIPLAVCCYRFSSSISNFRGHPPLLFSLQGECFWNSISHIACFRAVDVLMLFYFKHLLGLEESQVSIFTPASFFPNVICFVFFSPIEKPAAKQVTQRTNTYTISSWNMKTHFARYQRITETHKSVTHHQQEKSTSSSAFLLQPGVGAPWGPCSSPRVLCAGLWLFQSSTAAGASGSHWVGAAEQSPKVLLLWQGVEVWWGITGRE